MVQNNFAYEEPNTAVPTDGGELARLLAMRSDPNRDFFVTPEKPPFSLTLNQVAQLGTLLFFFWPVLLIIAICYLVAGLAKKSLWDRSVRSERPCSLR